MTGQGTMRLRSALAASLVPLVLAACATPMPLPDRFALGRDDSANRCAANRSWTDPQLSSQFDTAYVIGCEGAAASRALGAISVVPARARKPEPATACGAPTSADWAGIGPVEIRRCTDAALSAQAVLVRFDHGGRSYRGASIPSVAGPMRRALTALVDRAAPTGERMTLAFGTRSDAIAPAPVVEGAIAGDALFDPGIPLREGISNNRQGLYVEASRVLNDALSRMPAATPPGIQIELLLEAALADSNIRYSNAAEDHFKRAEALLARYKEGDQAAFLERKRSTYRAMDALNRRAWRAALANLKITDTGNPLEDPTLLAELNRPKNNDVSSAVAGRSSAQLSEVVLDAQRNWAQSVALLAQGDKDSIDLARPVLAQSATRIGGLLADPQIAPQAMLYLTAQVERQAGRIDARRGELLSGAERTQAYASAVARFDCAIAALRGVHPKSEAQCAIPLAPLSRSRLIAGAAQVSGPIVAETQIERASLREDAGEDPKAVLADFQQSIESLIASGRIGTSAPVGIEEYLDLLIKTADSDPASADRFFQAIQSIGEPGIARQLSQLQQVVSADGETAAQLRERAELNRDIAGLRYQIGDAAADPAARDALDKSRLEKERQLIDVEQKLGSNDRLRAIDDRPVAIADVQAKLGGDEVYFKLSEVRARTYGIVIGKSAVKIYASAASSTDLQNRANDVRGSIRSASAYRPPFKVVQSLALFRLIAGPAEEMLLGAKAIVVDPAGPLAMLPASVLVTDRESAIGYTNMVKAKLQGVRDQGQRAAVVNDYSKVAFLAGRASLSIALSPRSFVDARGVPMSTATQPFIGFGQHAFPIGSVSADLKEQIGLGCPVSRAELAAISEGNAPIDAHKIDVAAQALGVPNAPRMVGKDFTDTAVMARSDLGTFEVLHFATHGLPELKLECATIPPSLLTTMGEPHSDGFLSFNEVAALRLNANLVVLSACDTAASASQASARRSGQEDSGRSLDGLVRAFLTANARAVLATYWPVSVEAESDELFRTFYTKGRTEVIADSLRDAQRDLMEQPRYSHPYFWGAYFVVGDASKTMLSKPVAVAAK
jgi:hypothetical protein